MLYDRCYNCTPVIMLFVELILVFLQKYKNRYVKQLKYSNKIKKNSGYGDYNNYMIKFNIKIHTISTVQFGNLKINAFYMALCIIFISKM